MSGSAIVLAALLLGEPPVSFPSDPAWSACENGEPAARIESCARIANDTGLDLRSRSWALVLRAVAHADVDDNGGALFDLDRAIQMQPENWIAYRLSGDLELEEENFEAALADFDRALEISPQDPYTLLSRAEYFHRTKDYEKARQSIEEAILADPDMPDLYFARGRVALAIGDAEQAILDFEKYRGLRPNESATDYNLALSYRLAERLLDADAAINRVLEATPGDASALQQRAEIGLSLGEIDAALSDIEKALAIDPSNGSLLYTRGLVLRAQGAWEKAIADLSAALPKYPDDPRILIDRGLSYFANDDDEKALADAQAALAIDQGSTDALWLKGSALLYLGRYDDSLDAAAEGLALAPDDSRFLVLRGRAFLGQGNVAGAITALSQAIEKDPESSDAVVYRAAAMGALGLTTLPIAALSGVLQKEPDNTAALEQIVGLLGDAGDLEAALSAVDHLIELLPEVADYWWRKGDILVALKYFTAAPDTYEQALLLFGADAPLDLLRNYGMALVESGRPQEALAPLHAALAREPADPWTIGELGLAEQRTGRSSDAIVHLKRAIILYDDGNQKEFLRLGLADAHAAVRDYKRALDEYDAVLLRYPGDTDTMKKRGEVYRNFKGTDTAGFASAGVQLQEPEFLRAIFTEVEATLRKQGDLAEASRLLDAAIEAAPDASHSYFLRAWLRRGSGEYALALQDLDRVLSLKPASASVLNNRADLLLLMGRIEEARIAAEQTTSQFPEDGTGWVTLGQILIETGASQEALAALNKGVELGPASKADAFFYRALAHFRLGQVEPARRDLEDAARHDSGELAAKIAELKLKLFD